MLKSLTSLRQIRKLERASAETLAAYHNRLLPGVVRAAYDVPFYRALYDGAGVGRPDFVRSLADLDKLPIVDRNTYRLAPLEARTSPRFRPHQVQLNSTSGSTGKPLKTMESLNDLNYLRMLFLNDLFAAGLRPWHRFAYLKIHGFRPHPLAALGIMPFHQIRTDWDIARQADAFLKVKPQVLFGFFGTVYLLAKELERRGVAFKGLRGLLVGGESVPPTYRAQIERVFGCPLTELYGSTECFTIARSCRRGRLHLHAPQLITEVLRDDGTASRSEGEGEILITRLVSEAMPLVRYRIGDRIRLTPERCDCGQFHTPMVDQVFGRSNDLIRLADGRVIHPTGLLSVLDFFEGIEQTQLLQTAADTVEVRIVCPTAAPGLVEELLGKLAAKVPDLRFSLQFVDRIEAEPSGKIKVFKSKLKEAS